MNLKMVNRVTDVGIAVNIAAGHMGEMSGRAIQAAAEVLDLPKIKVFGKAVEAAGRAWSDAAILIGNRDRIRLIEP